MGTPYVMRSPLDFIDAVMVVLHSFCTAGTTALTITQHYLISLSRFILVPAEISNLKAFKT